MAESLREFTEYGDEAVSCSRDHKPLRSFVVLLDALELGFIHQSPYAADTPSIGRMCASKQGIKWMYII